MLIMVIIWIMMVNNNLVGGIPTPLQNVSSSVGMMIIPDIWKHKNVPNHQTEKTPYSFSECIISGDEAT